MPPVLPHPNCYWVLPGRFAAGEYPGNRQEDVARARLRRFLDCGITAFLDLTEPRELVPYDRWLLEEARACDKKVWYQRFPIRDVNIPRHPSQMVEILNTLDSWLEEGKVPYVHCWGGVGRTGTVVGCWLVRQGRTNREALAELSSLWQTVEKSWRKPRSPETSEQQQYVLAWHEPRLASPPSES